MDKDEFKVDMVSAGPTLCCPFTLFSVIRKFVVQNIEAEV